MSKETKHQFWEIIVYSESAPNDWIYRLESCSVRCCISPLHFKDKWDHDVISEDGSIKHKKGDLKKPHFHVLIHFSGGQTRSAVLEIATSCCCSKVIQWKSYPQNAYEYLDHHKVVSEFKPLYDAEEMINLCGFDPDQLRSLSKEERHELYKQIHQDILDLDLLEYSDLCDYYLLNDNMELYEIVINHTILYKGYIDSRRHKRKNLLK